MIDDNKLEKKGKIHIITGFGKMKSSSCFGTALRAINLGWDILVVQFLKGAPTGEVEVMQKYFADNVDIMRYGANKIVLPNNVETFDKEETQRGWGDMLSAINNKHYDMLILDEVLVALDMNLLYQKQFFDFLKDKPQYLEVFASGRVTSKTLMQKLTNVSDLHTDAYCRKHYLDRTCPNCKHQWSWYMNFCPNCGSPLDEPTFARKGIEM